MRSHTRPSIVGRLRGLLLALTLLFAPLLSLALASPALAASPIVVNDLGDDTTGGNSKCTLREALANANTNSDTTSSDCGAGSGADTITFSVSGTITLGSTLPAINDEVTIDGTGRSITVSGNNSVQVMFVNSGAGGAISNSGPGTLNVTNSTFTKNSANAFGGAISNKGNVRDSIATLNVTNSTFSGNSANTGAGISNDGTTTLKNTIVANNAGGDCLGGGTFTADAFNLDSDGSCANATTKTQAQINLGPLANNGGSTQTMALGASSAAIDAGDDAVCPSSDQRGLARPQGAHCDSGAFEF